MCVALEKAMCPATSYPSAYPPEDRVNPAQPLARVVCRGRNRPVRAHWLLCVPAQWLLPLAAWTLKRGYYYVWFCSPGKAGSLSPAKQAPWARLQWKPLFLVFPQSINRLNLQLIQWALQIKSLSELHSKAGNLLHLKSLKIQYLHNLSSTTSAWSLGNKI